MTPRDDQEESLDRLLRAALEKLPPRPAPPSLESRVLGELRRRAALPWWRRSFGSWPLPAQLALVAICTLLVGVTMLNGAPALAGISPMENIIAMALTWAHPAVVLITSASGVARVLTDTIPTAWLYGGLGLTVSLYAVLLGLSAAGYHFLYAHPSPARNPS
jgi:anti-sigma factor RsiW